MRQQTTDQHTYRIGLRGHAVAPDRSCPGLLLPWQGRMQVGEQTSSVSPPPWPSSVKGEGTLVDCSVEETANGIRSRQLMQMSGIHPRHASAPDHRLLGLDR